DFETFHVGEVMPVGTRSPFFARVSREKVVFACSLEKNIQKKVKEDLEAAAKLTVKRRGYVFSAMETWRWADATSCRNSHRRRTGSPSRFSMAGPFPSCWWIQKYSG